MGISRSATWTAHGLDSLFMSPLVLPALAFGLSALIHFSWLGLQVSMTTLVIGIRWSACPTW
jgi:putative spermidine/putrescine transport system permease protein